MNTVERLEAEIAEMEAHLNPTQEDTQEKAEEVKEVVETVSAPQVDTSEAVEVPEKPARTNWKKKYEENSRRTAGLKASSDQFKFQTRQEIQELKNTIEMLKTQVTQVPPTDIFDGVVTEEDKDTIGSEAVDIMKKISERANEAQVNPLRNEIVKLQKEREEARVNSAQVDAKREYDSFLDKLNKQVPDYKAINTNPEFLTYMGNVDEASGYTKATLFQRAEASRDVKRVAGYMKEFVESQKPVDKLEEMVGPTGSSSTSVTSQGTKEEIIPVSYIENFKNSMIRGQYKTNHIEAEKIQLKIDKALQEGRVDFRR